MMFIDRKSEFQALLKEFRTNGFRLIVIYGRRRAGKTRLSVEAARRQGLYFYFLCDEGKIEDNAMLFARRVAEILNDYEPLVNTFEETFDHLKKCIGDQLAIVIIDEFPYLVKSDSTIVSHFERIVGDTLSETNIKLILVGSSMGMMESHALSYQSPLYMDLERFSHSRHLKDVFKTYLFLYNSPRTSE